MSDRFKQKELRFKKEANKETIKVSDLMTLLEGHPYESKIKKVFNTDSIKDEFIVVGNILTVFKRLQIIQSEYILNNIRVHTKDVSFGRGKVKVEGIRDNDPLIFNISNFINEDGEEIDTGLAGYPIYESKSQFFDDFSMTKYANMLFDKRYDELAEINLQYFRLQSTTEFNKYKSYRLVQNGGEIFVRGITSLNYKEYGVDFSFVISMLMLHSYMKKTEGNNYTITFAALNESKLELIITSDELKDAGDFGQIRSAISVKTNDFGKGALTLSHIINVAVKGGGFYLYPKSNPIQKKDISINHGKTPVSNALRILSNLGDFYGYADVFIDDLKKVKSIKTPDELRKRIILKFEHHNSLLNTIKGDLKPLFSTVLSDDIKDFARLLEMCRKAEELEIDYDLKEKLRVEISDIIFNK